MPLYSKPCCTCPSPSLGTTYGCLRLSLGIIFASLFLEDCKTCSLVMGALTAVHTPRAATAITQFLTLIRTCPNAAAITLLIQSINVWLAYYPSLRTVLGGYSPSVVAFMHEQFYVFAHAMLDAITATFCSFFGLSWTGAEVSHTHLTNEFLRLCALYQFHGDPQNLLTQMRDLHARIIARQSSDMPQGAATSSRDTLTDLVIRLDRYIVALCEFLSANLERSVLHVTSHQE